MKYLLGIDIDTCSVKAVALDLQCQSFAGNPVRFHAHQSRNATCAYRNQ